MSELSDAIRPAGAATVAIIAARTGRSPSWVRRRLAESDEIVKGGSTASGANRYWLRKLPREWSCTLADATVAAIAPRVPKGEACQHTPAEETLLRCARRRGHTGRCHAIAGSDRRILAVW